MNKWIRGTNTVVMSLAVVGIFIVLTIFLNSVKGIQWDLTTNKKYTLSEQTADTLKQLDRDVNLRVFTGGNAAPYAARQVLDLAREYQKLSDRIIFDEYDMVKEPAVARQYEVDPGGMIVVESGEDKKNIYFYELFTPGDDGYSYNFVGEEKFTQAIVNLTVKEKRKVYYLTGHGEFPSGDLRSLKSDLAGENYELADLNLYKEGKIPDDAEMLLIVGPQHDFSDSEAELLKQYLQGNGKLFMALGFSTDMAGWKNIDSILAEFGLKNDRAIVVEPKRSIFADPLTIIPSYGMHDIVNKLFEYDYFTVMSLASSLSAGEEKPEMKATVLLKTSENAYGETDLNELVQGTSTQNEQDLKSPMNLAYAIENKDGKPKAVIVGGSSFLTDQLIHEQGNRDFFMNSMNWLQEQQNQITIRPREGEQIQQAFILPHQANLIFYGTVVGFPLVFLVIGGFIWWRRRKG